MASFARASSLLVLAILAAAAAVDAHNFKIVFKVEDCYGKPVQDATVKVTGCTRSTKSVKTNWEGLAVFDNEVQYCDLPYSDRLCKWTATKGSTQYFSKQATLEQAGSPTSPRDITGCDCSRKSECYQSNECFGYKKTIVLKQKTCKPVDCEGYWQQLKACDAKCGKHGKRAETFVVTKPAAFGGKCPNQGKKKSVACELTKDQINKQCKADCHGYWKHTKSCNATCTKHGKVEETFIVTKPAQWGGKCTNQGKKRYNTCELSKQQREKRCKVDCIGSWKHIKACDATCTSHGKVEETYIITRWPKNGGKACPVHHMSKRTETCELTPQQKAEKCKADCQGYWKHIKACNATCSKHGKVEETFIVTKPAQFGGKCPHEGKKRYSACELTPQQKNERCKVDCVAYWKITKDCNATCTSHGKVEKTYIITTSPKFGGKACEHAHNTKKYITCELSEANKYKKCKVDCVGKWISEGCKSCTATCEKPEGYYERKYKITTPANYGGKPCPYPDGYIDKVTCYLKDYSKCPRDCEGYYKPVKECNATCENPHGVKTLKFMVTQDSANGGKECPPKKKYEPCQLKDWEKEKCKVDCDGRYKVVEKCNATCEYPTGVIVKKFLIEEEPQFGGKECPPEYQYAQCTLEKYEQELCKKDCQGYWKQIQGCNATCDSGTGYKVKQFVVTCPAEFGGKECEAEDGEVKYISCEKKKPCGKDCEGDFEHGGCTATCEHPGYYYQVFRITQNKTYSGDDCDYEDGYIKLTNKRCEAENCPVNCEGRWVYKGCNATECGSSGFRYRVFYITLQATEGGKQCDYSDGYKEVSHKPCEADPCPPQDCEGKFELGNCSATECGASGFYYKIFRVTKPAANCGERCEYEDGEQKLSNKCCEAPKCPAVNCTFELTPRPCNATCEYPSGEEGNLLIITSPASAHPPGFCPYELSQNNTLVDAKPCSPEGCVTCVPECTAAVEAPPSTCTDEYNCGFLPPISEGLKARQLLQEPEEVELISYEPTMVNITGKCSYSLTEQDSEAVAYSGAYNPCPEEYTNTEKPCPEGADCGVCCVKLPVNCLYSFDITPCNATCEASGVVIGTVNITQQAKNGGQPCIRNGEVMQNGATVVLQTCPKLPASTCETCVPECTAEVEVAHDPECDDTNCGEVPAVIEVLAIPGRRLNSEPEKDLLAQALPATVKVNLTGNCSYTFAPAAPAEEALASVYPPLNPCGAGYTDSKAPCPEGESCGVCCVKLPVNCKYVLANTTCNATCTEEGTQTAVASITQEAQNGGKQCKRGGNILQDGQVIVIGTCPKKEDPACEPPCPTECTHNLTITEAFIEGLVDYFYPTINPTIDPALSVPVLEMPNWSESRTVIINGKCTSKLIGLLPDLVAIDSDLPEANIESAPEPVDICPEGYATRTNTKCEGTNCGDCCIPEPIDCKFKLIELDCPTDCGTNTSRLAMVLITMEGNESGKRCIYKGEPVANGTIVATDSNCVTEACPVPVNCTTVEVPVPCNATCEGSGVTATLIVVTAEAQFNGSCPVSQNNTIKEGSLQTCSKPAEECFQCPTSCIATVNITEASTEGLETGAPKRKLFETTIGVESGTVRTVNVSGRCSQAGEAGCPADFPQSTATQCEQGCGACCIPESVDCKFELVLDECPSACGLASSDRNATVHITQAGNESGKQCRYNGEVVTDGIIVTAVSVCDATDPCPVNCTFTEVQGPCSVVCPDVYVGPEANGVTSKIYIITAPAANGGSCAVVNGSIVPNSEEPCTITCSPPSCPADNTCTFSVTDKGSEITYTGTCSTKIGDGSVDSCPFDYIDTEQPCQPGNTDCGRCCIPRTAACEVDKETGAGQCPNPDRKCVCFENKAANCPAIAANPLLDTATLAMVQVAVKMVVMPCIRRSREVTPVELVAPLHVTSCRRRQKSLGTVGVAG